MMVPPSREENRRESIRRIQIGAAGLGGVMMLVGLTNVLVDNIRKDGGLGSGIDVVGGLVPGNHAETAKSNEPLADLGVTPASDAGAQQAVPAVPDLEPDPHLQKPMDRDPRQGQ